MSLVEMIPMLDQLDRADKFRVIQHLTRQLANEEMFLSQQDSTYPIWSPHAAYEAADVMLKVLREDAGVSYE